MSRETTYNFAAGPSALPTEVLEIAASELLDYKSSGMSVMEMSHRSSTYQAIFDQTKAAAMPEQLPRAVKEARAGEAQTAAERMQEAYLDAQVGRTLPVLFETAGEDGLWQGHSDNYCAVLAQGEALHGIIKNVQIIARKGKKIVGNIV